MLAFEFAVSNVDLYEDVGYIIAFVIDAFFGIFGVGLIAASGKHNACEESYEQGKHDALKETHITD